MGFRAANTNASSIFVNVLTGRNRTLCPLCVSIDLKGILMFKTAHRTDPVVIGT